MSKSTKRVSPCNFGAGTQYLTAVFCLMAAQILAGCASGSSGSHTNSSSLAITSNSMPSARVQTAYSATLTATGGTTPYSWSIASGSLPVGLSLSSPTGQITGTPSQAGISSFTVQVTDSSSPAQTAKAQLSITAAAATATLQITSTTIPSGQVGLAYSTTLLATGGGAPYRWTINSGSLPAGLSLNASTGQITGTPTQSGSYSFAVQVKDSSNPAQVATQALNTTIAAAVTPLTITTQSLAYGQQGAPYSATLNAAGGTAPYIWSLLSGTMPSGLALSPAGQISGIPTQNGSFTFTLQVKDSGSPAQTASQSFAISVALNGGILQVTTVSLANGQVGVSYSAPITAIGGIQPYTWSVTFGNLPAGLTVNNTASSIVGTPTQSGSDTFTLQVRDSSPAPQTASKSLSITIAASVAPVLITTSSVPSGQGGTAYSTTLAASGGTTPYSWNISSGALPAGLTLSSAGTISGTPTVAGSFGFTVKVTDSTTPTAQTATQSLSLSIAHSAVLSWTASTSSDVTGYNVYRSTVSGGSYTKINSSLVAGSSYTDSTVVSGKTYYYVTTSVDSSGVESLNSKEVQAVIP